MEDRSIHGGPLIPDSKHILTHGHKALGWGPCLIGWPPHTFPKDIYTLLPSHRPWSHVAAVDFRSWGSQRMWKWGTEQNPPPTYPYSTRQGG